MNELKGLAEWLRGVNNLTNVSRVAGVALSTVRKIKQGIANPTTRTINALLKVKRSKPPGW